MKAISGSPIPRLLWLAVSTSGFLACFACSAPEPPFGPGPARNLILISLDTVRPDHLGAYGYDKNTSPTIDRLAAAGALFTDTVAVSPWTRPSNATLLTGVYPLHHGARSFRTVLAKDVPSLPELLGQAGFQTAAIVSSIAIDETSGLDRGFDSFRYVSEWQNLPGGERRPRDPGSSVTRNAIHWLSGRGETRFFLFLHYYDAHSDYSPRAEYRRLFAGDYSGPVTGSTDQLMEVVEGRRRLSEADVVQLTRLYDAGIRQLDAEIGELLRHLDEQDLARDTAILVTSDHGEEFMEHGGVLHARTYYREVIDVPLVVAGPGVPPGWRSDAVASHIDIAPTLLGLAGLPVPSAMDGLDLGRHWGRGPLPPEDRILFAEADHSNETSDQYRMVRTARYKLILNRRNGVARFYDLVADPDERHDVRLKHLADVNEQLAALHDFEATRVVSRRSLDLSRERREALRQLGYVE
jgi:arylsulfatase A-like enzyme